MRSHEGNEAQVCYFIIQLLLLKPNDFRNRVSDFVKENSPEHWLQNDWHTKHMNYHKVPIQIPASVNPFQAILRYLAVDVAVSSVVLLFPFWSLNFFKVLEYL